MKKSRRKLKKKFWVVGAVLVIVLVLGGGYYCYSSHQKELLVQKNERILRGIKKHYGDTVTISKDTTLYTLDNGKYNEVGSIGKGEVINLAKAEITIDTKYFKLKDYDFYVSYKDIKKGGEVLEKDARYKNYIPFNENVVTKEKVKLYRGENLVYISNKALDLPIIVKEDNGYYVEYMKELLFIKSEDVASVRENHNTDLAESTSIPVTVYHFIYKEGDTSCKEKICHPESQIRSHFDYLKENNFFTMNSTELRLFIEGKLRVPLKSLMITIDDGARAEHFVPLLNEYKINATLFVITSRFTDLTKFESKYMELGSHTNNLHDVYGGASPCSGSKSLLTCRSKDELVQDLKASRVALNNTEAFCYPLYIYNDHVIEGVKEAGFKIAFIGGGRNVTRGIDLYKVPRRPLNNRTTLEQYISMLN